MSQPRNDDAIDVFEVDKGSGLPSFLNCTERIDEDRLLYQHFGEPLDEGA